MRLILQTIHTEILLNTDILIHCNLMSLDNKSKLHMFIRIVMRFSLLTGEPGLTLTENIKLQLPSDRIQDSERGFVNIIGKYTNYCICKDLHFFFSFSLRRTYLRYSSEPRTLT